MARIYFAVFLLVVFTACGPIAGAARYQFIANDITGLSPERAGETFQTYANLATDAPSVIVEIEEVDAAGRPLALVIQVTAWNADGELVGSSELWAVEAQP